MSPRPITRVPLARLLDAYAAIAREEILRDFDPNCCIAATRITLAVCREFGWRGQPLSVDAWVANARFVDYRNELGDREPSLEEAQAAAGAGVKAVEIDNHVIAVINRQWIVDAALDQAARPAHGIELPPVFVRDDGTMLLRDGELRGWLTRGPLTRVWVSYARRTDRLAYQRAPDWLDTLRHAPAIARILGRLAHLRRTV